MRTLLIGINAKYIHPNLAIRFLQKNTSYDVDIIEFTIKDKIEEMINKISQAKYDLLGFSCYIWNIEIIEEILRRLKPRTNLILLGGPEVSYKPYKYFDEDLCDFLIAGEGEEAFSKLLSYLNNAENLDSIPNLYTKNGFTYQKRVDLNELRLPYDLYHDLGIQIIYVETQRGCPYRCAYCLSSLDGKVLYYNLDNVLIELKKILDKKPRVIKFLDRSANIDKKHFLKIIAFFKEKYYPELKVQFEIVAELMDKETILLIHKNLPKDYIRFEIGIQSLNKITNELILRRQDSQKLCKIIETIRCEDKIILHLDLIAGLPEENLKSFEDTFNRVIKLRPHELQLGFLKLLKGTYLEKVKDNYLYHFSDDAPYEIIENKDLSIEDIKYLKEAEGGVDLFYNSRIAPNFMSLFIAKILNPLSLFHELFTNLADKTLETRFKLLDSYLDNEHLRKTLIIDYLSYFNLKPKIWWEIVSRIRKREIIENELINMEYCSNDFYNYGLFAELDNYIIVALYFPGHKVILEWNKKDHLLQNKFDF